MAKRGRKSAEPHARQLIALLSALDDISAPITVEGICNRLLVSPEEAEELIQLLIECSAGEDYWLPITVSDDGREVYLLQKGTMQGRPLRLTPAEVRALNAALDTLGIEIDNPLRIKLATTHFPTTFPSAKAPEPHKASPQNNSALTCAEALGDGRALSFLYQGSAVATPALRHVLPTGLRQANTRGTSDWYLDAYDLDKHEDRIFRLDRMEHLELGSRADAALHGATPVAAHSVELVFSNPALLDVFTWYQAEIVARDAAGIHMRLPWFGGSWLPRQLAACGAHVTIADDELRAATERYATELLATDATHAAPQES